VDGQRSFRYKEEALYSHAPQTPGIYQLVTFDEQQNGVILYIGLASEKTIFDALYEHWRGDRQPTVQDLLAKYPNLILGMSLKADIKDKDDLKDLYWAMSRRKNLPCRILKAFSTSGRYSEITYKISPSFKRIKAKAKSQKEKIKVYRFVL